MAAGIRLSFRRVEYCNDNAKLVNYYMYMYFCCFALPAKKFHVPTQWMQNSSLRFLVEHRYSRLETVEVFQQMEGALKDLGYNQDNQLMVHDYIHYMMMDILASKGVAFLSENDIRGLPALMATFDKKTPDLIVSGAGVRKMFIVDIYIGKSADVVSAKKAKYKSLGSMFDVHCINDFATIARDLSQIFDPATKDYIYNQLNLFLTEYAYWRTCLKFKKILLNDVESSRIKEIQPAANFADSVVVFQTGLLSMCADMLKYSHL